MKTPALLSSTVALLAMFSASCHKADDRRPRDTRAQDTAVAAELRQAADTAAFRDAADVAMSDIPDSTLPMPPRRTMISHAPGQVAARPAPPMQASRAAPSRAMPSPVPAAAAPLPSTTPTMRAAAPSDARPSQPVATPVLRPARPATAPATTPRARAAEVADPAPATPAAPRAAEAADPIPACASPAMADQRRCLMAYLGQSDRVLDRNYQARIAQLRAEEGTPAGAADPPSVEKLRAAQRAWLVYRDTECRNRNRGQEGPLWAPVRARCLGEFSQDRAAELAR